MGDERVREVEHGPLPIDALADADEVGALVRAHQAAHGETRLELVLVRVVALGERRVEVEAEVVRDGRVPVAGEDVETLRLRERRPAELGAA